MSTLGKVRKIIRDEYLASMPVIKCKSIEYQMRVLNDVKTIGCMFNNYLKRGMKKIANIYIHIQTILPYSINLLNVILTKYSKETPI